MEKKSGIEEATETALKSLKEDLGDKYTPDLETAFLVALREYEAVLFLREIMASKTSGD